MSTFRDRIRGNVFAPVRFLSPFPHHLLGVCGSAHIDLYSASKASTVTKVPHIFILHVLIQSSPSDSVGFPRRRCVKAKSSFMSLNPSPLILYKMIASGTHYCDEPDGLFTNRYRCKGEAVAHEAVVIYRKGATTKVL